MLRLRRPRSPVTLLRRCLAAALAVGALVLALRPPAAPAAVPPPGTPVVTAAADLAAGTVLTTADLVSTELPVAAAPAGAAVDPAALTGRVLAAPVRAGEPVTDVRLVGPGLTELLPTGQVAAPVRLSDLAVAGLATAGDRVDVLATAPGAVRAEVVARAALVLAAPRAATEDVAAPADAGLLVLAVDEATAAALAAAATTATLTLSLPAGPGPP
ncbi:Flp pilus assembly protein CpaB [Geodermatophilus maliterrae]|uniref:Flp pilus assembly protein CpaB n=1 Tax=Geodermatophilus maliterrae TaxID=3162531 RepID=A0ABV3XNV4_9ACTN